MHKVKNRKCTVCSAEISEKYCSNCGQYFKNKRVTFFTILGDLFDNVFSLEKSFFKNMKTGLSQPEKIVLNYWNGYRGFYYSPGRFFTITSLFMALHYLFSTHFLGIKATAKNDFPTELAITLLNILFLTFLSFIITYLKYKKNFYEHLILNIYNVSLWTILFVPISILSSQLNVESNVEVFLFIPFHILIILWNSRAFEMSKLRRFMFVALNFIILYGTLIYINTAPNNY
jgi:hypothetical protein